MTEQAIKEFGIMPEGAIIHVDYKSYSEAIDDLIKKKSSGKQDVIH